MSLDPKLLPPNVVRLMDPAEQKRLGYVSPEKAKEKRDDMAEKTLHEQVANLLRLRGVRYLGHSRMDRKSTRRVGEPDLTFAYFKAWLNPAPAPAPIPCAIELKRPGETATPEQVRCLADMEADGWHTLVADNLQAVKEFLDSL